MNDIDLVVGINSGNIQKELNRIESQIKKSANNYEKLVQDAYEEGIEKGARDGTKAAESVVRKNVSSLGTKSGKDFSFSFGKSFTDSFKQSGSTLNALGQSFKSAAASVPGLGLAVAAVGTAAAASFKVISDGLFVLREFETAVAEVNTILPENQRLTEAVTKSFGDFAIQFGTSSTEQARSFYQIVSAGITGAAESTELLLRANELAQGGLTEIGTAIDVLTTAINVYGKENITAAEASDSLFTAVRLGKTNTDELSQALGRVLPLAKAVGVDFDTVNAALATLTARGVDTNLAVTQLGALFTSLSRNSERLGDGLNLAALNSKGLSQFLEDLSDKAGGSSEGLFKLLGESNAVLGALNLTGDATDQLNSNLDEFTRKAGAATSASNELAKTGENIDRQLTSAYDEFAKTLAEFVAPSIDTLKESATELFVSLRNVIGIFSDGPSEIQRLRGELERLRAVQDETFSESRAFRIQAISDEIFNLEKRFGIVNETVKDTDTLSGKFFADLKKNAQETSPLVESIALKKEDFDKIIKDTSDGIKRVQDTVAKNISTGNEVQDIALRVSAQFDLPGLQRNLQRVIETLQNQDLSLSDAQRAALETRQRELTDAIAGISTITLNRQRDFAEKLVAETLKGSTGILDKINNEFQSVSATDQFTQIEIDTRIKFGEEALREELQSIRDRLSQADAFRLTEQEIASLRERETQVVAAFSRIDQIVTNRQQEFVNRSVNSIVSSGTGSFEAIDNAIARLQQSFEIGRITEEEFTNNSFLLQERRFEISEGLFEQFRTNLERINAEEIRLLDELNMARDGGVISEQRYQNQLLKIRSDSQKKRVAEKNKEAAAIKKTEDKERQQTLGTLSAISSATSDFFTVAQALAGEDKEKQKNIAIANAIINTGLAVSKSLASAPAPLNLIPAAAALASGIATVRAIQAERTPNIGGGGAGISASNTGGTGNGLPQGVEQNTFADFEAESPTLTTPVDSLVNARPTVINLNVEGNILDSRESGLEIMRLITEASETLGAQLPNQVVAS